MIFRNDSVTWHRYLVFTLSRRRPFRFLVTLFIALNHKSYRALWSLSHDGLVNAFQEVATRLLAWSEWQLTFCPPAQIENWNQASLNPTGRVIANPCKETWRVDNGKGCKSASRHSPQIWRQNTTFRASQAFFERYRNSRSSFLPSFRSSVSLLSLYLCNAISCLFSARPEEELLFCSHREGDRERLLCCLATFSVEELLNERPHFSIDKNVPNFGGKNLTVFLRLISDEM